MMVVNACDFPITTVHDSFGCLLADMPDLYCIVREQFVELYRLNPLDALFYDLGADIDNVEFGTLDIEGIIDSEYAFA